MSLILDALRKLEREKGSHEPGVLVVGSVPWGERSRTSRILLLAGAVAVLLLAAGVGWMLRPVRQAPSVSAPVPSPQSPPARPAPTPPRLPAPSVAPATTPSTLPAPPPIRLSRPPASTRPAIPAAPPTTAAAGRSAEPAPAVAEDPAAASTAGEADAEASDASRPSSVELSSAPPAPDAGAPASREAPGAATATAAPRTPAAGPGELRLTAISQRDGRPVALINDRLVFEGDSFDGVRILRIGESEVEVEVRGEKKTLRF